MRRIREEAESEAVSLYDRPIITPIVQLHRCTSMSILYESITREITTSLQSSRDHISVAANHLFDLVPWVASKSTVASEGA